MSRTLVNTLSGAGSRNNFLDGDSANFEGGIGSWVKYYNNTGAIARAALSISTGGASISRNGDGGTGLVLTAVANGNPGNKVAYQTDDNNGSGILVTVSTTLAGDSLIAVSTDGVQTNTAVVNAINGNGAAAALVTASTGSGGSTYASPTPTLGPYFYLNGGRDAAPGAFPRDATSGTPAGTTTLTRLPATTQSTLLGAISGKASMIWDSGGVNMQQGSGISVPFSGPPGYSGYWWRPIKIVITASISSSSTIKPYIVDVDTGLVVDLTAKGGTYGFWGTGTGWYVVQHVFEFVPRPGSQNFRLAFHNAANAVSNQTQLIMDEFYVGPSEDRAPFCSAVSGNAQSLASGTLTVATLSAADDPLGLITSNNVIIPSTGTWAYEAQATFGANSTGYRYVSVQRSTDGGTTWFDIAINRNGAAPTDQSVTKVSRRTRLNQGDRLRVALIQTSGGNLSTVSDGNQNFFSLSKAGD